MRRHPPGFGDEHPDTGTVDVGDFRQIDDELALAGGDHLVHVLPEREVPLVEREFARECQNEDVAFLPFSDFAASKACSCCHRGSGLRCSLAA
jgi:hypothetical protein